MVASRIRAHPALSLFVLAVLLGLLLLVPVILGVAPPALVQLGALSASAAGFILAGLEGGRPAVRELLGRAAIWRVGLRWWLLALLIPVAPVLALMAVTTATGGSVLRPDTSLLPLLVPTLLFQVVFAGIGEEFGWRGFALPRLQRRHSALAASLMIGSLHAAWHLPLFLLPDGPFAAFAGLGLVQAFLGYAVLVMSLAVLLTWVFNNTSGSVLLAAVLHGSFNTWNGMAGIESAGTRGLLLYVALVAGLALIVVMATGPRDLGRGRRQIQGELLS